MVVDKEQPVPKWLKINHKFSCFKKKVRDDSIVIERVQTTKAMWEKLETLANKTILVFQIILTIFVQVRSLPGRKPGRKPGLYLGRKSLPLSTRYDQDMRPSRVLSYPDKLQTQ